MPALSFLPRFAPLVERGDKCQTIRPVRKRPIVPGDRLVLYAGMRTKACCRIGEAVCHTARPVFIQKALWPPDGRIVEVGGVLLFDWEVTPFARKDGFENADEFFAFFERHYGLPFHGVLIEWGD